MTIYIRVEIDSVKICLGQVGGVTVQFGEAIGNLQAM
jgi:hypothetical protein